MANFQTNVQEWSGGFAPASPVTAKKSDAWGELAANLVPNLLNAAGSGWARGQGANVLGNETSNVEALEAVKGYETEAGIFAKEGESDEFTKAHIEDLRDAALRKFGTDDKKIQALVNAGKISTIEANARRNQMLQEKLSNPVLAMFKDDFLEASAPWTGGKGSLASQYFGAYLPTEEERMELKAVEDVITAKAKRETAVRTLMDAANVSREAAQSIILEQEQRAQKLADAEEAYKLRNFSSQESFVAGMQVVDNFMQETGGAVAAMAASGRMFGDAEMQSMQGRIMQSYQQNMGRLMEFGKSMTTEDFTKARHELDRQRAEMIKLTKDADAYKAFERSVGRIRLNNEATIGQAYATLASKIPFVLAAYKISPNFGDAYVGAMDGDMGSEFKLQTHPVWSKLAPVMGYVDAKTAAVDGMGKLATNDKEGWTVAGAISTLTNFVRPGNAKNVVAGVNENEDAYKAMFATAFNNADMSISPFADSKEWQVNSNTPEGAKATALMVEARMSSLRSMQLARKQTLPKDLEYTKGKQDYYDPTTGEKTQVDVYQFNTRELDHDVQSEIVAMHKLASNPNVLKQLGATTPEEWVRKAFNGK